MISLIFIGIIFFENAKSAKNANLRLPGGGGRIPSGTVDG